MVIPTKILRALTRLVASGPTKYRLDRVLLRRKADRNAEAVACDGRRLLITRWRDDDDRPMGESGKFAAMIDPAELARACGPSELVAELHRGCVTLRPPLRTVRLETGRYPNYEEVVPACEKPTTPDHPGDHVAIKVDAGLLIELLDAMRWLLPANDPSVTLSLPTGQSRCLRIDLHGTIGAVAVLLPMTEPSLGCEERCDP